MTEFLDMEVAELPPTHKLCYLGGCSFDRNSVAYDWQGEEIPTDYPRFEHRVPDTTVTNLLTGNQSDGGDTNNPELLTLNQRTGTDALGTTEGFSTNNSATISSSSEQAHSNSKSLKCITNGSAVDEGVKWTATVTNTTHIQGAWIYAPIGALLRLAITGKNATSFTGTGTWQYVEVNGTLDAGTAEFRVTTITNTQAITFYVDDLRLAKNDTTGYSSSGGATLSITGETSKQGYRSLKVATTGGNQGVFTNPSATVSASSNYTRKVNVKAPIGESLKIEMYDGVNFISTVNFTGTGDWQEVSASATTTTGTSLRIYVRTNTTNPITFYLDQDMLETGSTSHDWAYGGSSYNTYKTEYGCLIEEAHTNLLTANQSTGTDTSGNTTGFGAYGTGTVISSSTDYAIQGTKSLKVVTDGSVQYGGVFNSPMYNSAASTTYTASMWVLAPKGVAMDLYLAQTGVNSARTYFTGTGEWQFVSATLTTSGATGTVQILPRTIDQTATTFYVDMLQLTKTAYPLSWTLGGTTQAAETLTAPSSVLNIDTEGYSNLLTANQANACEDGTTTGFSSTGGATVSVDSSEFIQGSKSLKTITGTTQYAGSWFQIASVVGVTYTLSGKIKGNLGDTIYLTGSGWSGSATTLTLTGGWDTFELTRTASATAITYRFATPDTTSRTFYIDELQLTATSTAKPWIPGGTTQSETTNTFECEIYANGTSFNFTNTQGRIFQQGTSRYILMRALSASSLRIATYDGASQTQLNPTIVAPNGFNKCALTLDENSIKVHWGGALVGTANNPILPRTTEVIGFGGMINGTQQCNTIIRNIVISRPKRADADVTARAGFTDDLGFPADEDCTLIMPLKHDLSAFRVVER